MLASEDDLDAPLLDLARQMGAHVVVKAAQDIGAAIDQGRLDAQTGEDARELNRDIAAARDQDALGQLRQVEGLFGGDGVLDAGQVRDRDPAAGGDQDFAGRDRAVLADEIAGAAFFLASRDAAFMTGQSLIMDGGRSTLSGVLE
jgi:hypothetical protein